MSSSTPAAPISPASASPSPCAPSAASSKPGTASSPFWSRDYLLGLKNSQPTLHQLAQSRLSSAIRDEWVSDWEKDHGRIERRRPARVDLDQDISPFPGARQLIRITREWTEGKNAELKSETRYFITSLD